MKLQRLMSLTRKAVDDYHMIEEGDKIHFASAANSLGDFLKEINHIESPLRNIMILGGGNIGYYLADDLSKKKFKVKIIEKDIVRAEEIAEDLEQSQETIKELAKML